jgi:hypothetical protein
MNLVQLVKILHYICRGWSLKSEQDTLLFFDKQQDTLLIHFKCRISSH